MRWMLLPMQIYTSVAGGGGGDLVSDQTSPTRYILVARESTLSLSHLLPSVCLSLAVMWLYTRYIRARYIRVTVGCVCVCVVCVQG